MSWLEAVQAVLVILEWLKNNPPSGSEISQEQLDEVNRRMNEAVANWKNNP